MRKIIDPQIKLGQVDISKIEFDLRSRDEIPKLLMGLQYIYCTPEIREEVFRILEEMIPANISVKTGRKGMELWKILVLGTIRLNCNWDYDKLQEIANNHMTLRKMLGHGILEDDYKYAIQTLRDNISLFTPEILDKINQVVVKAGHNLVKKKETKLRGKCDSYVVETDVHYPTDINLLFDAMRKVITIIAETCERLGFSDWRQSKYNLKKIKKLFCKAQNSKRSTSKDKEKIKAREEIIREAYKTYTEAARTFIDKAKETINKINESGFSVAEAIISVMSIEKYIVHAQRQIDQIERRVLSGEEIPHDEKVFSIFEEHTEWICKGKAGISQELGLRVCIVEDQHGFILNHQVMQKQTDDQIAVSLIKETREKFEDLTSCSFDKGFYSAGNKKELKTILEEVVIPKKGKLSEVEKEEEHAEGFIVARRRHSAVESGINALEVHGLDRCLDHGIVGFKRYAALGILSRNIQILGNIAQQKAKRIKDREQKLAA